MSNNWSKYINDFRSQLHMLYDVKPEEIKFIIRASQVGVLTSIINATILVALTWSEENWFFLSLWLTGAILTFTYVAYRSHQARKHEPKRVSNKAKRRLILFTILFAFPWTIITYEMLGSQNTLNNILITMMCGGMASGGSMILYRVPIAAFAYIATVMIGAAITIVIKQFDVLWPVIVYAVCYVAVLVDAIMSSWKIARERENSLSDASVAKEKLQSAYNEIKKIAKRDPLTRLSNRKEFINQLVLKITDTNVKPFAVLLLDLDRFKNINDSLGHGAGDELLKVIAKRLKMSVSRKDTIARFGGDEFALIVDLGDTELKATTTAQKILNNLNKPVPIDSAVIHPNASIGIAIFPDHTDNHSDLISLSDTALHHAKTQGRGCYRIYSSDMASSGLRADGIEKRLRYVLENNKLEIYYQPKINLQTEEVIGVEALLRCFDGEGEIIPTKEILDIAEERGLILPISSFIYEQVTKDISFWRNNFSTPIPVSINVHDFDLKTTDWLSNQLQTMFKNGIRTNDIQLEITESSLVGRGTDAISATLDTIDEMEISISLDDYGTGQATLSQLKKIPFNELKIDSEFIRGITNDYRDKAIIKAAMELANSLKISCVLEGIETKEQLEIINSLQPEGLLTIGQGYYWSTPLKVADFIAYVQARRNVLTAKTL